MVNLQIRAVRRGHATVSGGAPAYAKCVCTRLHTRTRKCGTRRRLPIAAHDRHSRARRLASLARPSLALRTFVVREESVRSPGQDLPHGQVICGGLLGCGPSDAVRTVSLSPSPPSGNSAASGYRP